MEIKSENIKRYIENNVDIKGNEIELEDIRKLDRININALNFKLEEAIFVPEELSYLQEINECSFANFTITDEIIENLNKLKKLSIFQFDFCKSTVSKKIYNNISRIYLNYSDFSLLEMCDNTESMETVFLKNIKDIDVSKINKFRNLKRLSLLNSEVNNIESLEKFENLEEVKIIGSKINNIQVLENLKNRIKIEYSEDEYFNIG